MAGTKPQTALKPQVLGQNMSPALMKFMSKQNEALNDQKSVPEEAEKKPLASPPKGIKNGVDSATNANQNENNKSVTCVSKIAASARPSVGTSQLSESRRTSQVNVPLIFQQNSTNKSTFAENRRSSQVNVPEVFKTGSKSSAASAELSDENKKPKPLAKPGHTVARPPPAPKPQTSNIDTSTTNSSAPFNLTQNTQNKEQQSFINQSSKVKLPVADFKEVKKIHSTTASTTESAVTNSLSSQSPPASEEKLVGSKSNLRPTKGQIAAQWTDKVALKPPGSMKKMTGLPVEPSTNGSKDSVTSKNSQDKPDGLVLPFQLQENLHKNSIEKLKHEDNEPVIKRICDAKKFKKIKLELACPVNSTVCEKAALPCNIDLTLIKQQYQRTLESLDDLYDDCSSATNELMRKSSNRRPQSERISLIPDMTEEEELLYDDGSTPSIQLTSISSNKRVAVAAPDTEETYVDAETERKDDDQVYEDEETLALYAEKLEEEKKRQQKEETEAKKREEKERKEREKEEEKKRKNKEKERLKKEKEEMQLRKKFNLTGTETSVGEGIIKQDVKGGMLGGLSLKKGQTITIVRLDNNPPNKWLVRSETNMGYIDSSVIEIDPAIIKQAMVTKAMEASHCKLSRDDDDNQPVYDDVPNDGRPTAPVDDEEIYEECA